MRWSQFYLFTTRESPSDAEVVSHRLMVRSGMLRKLAAGIYTYLPMGWRSVLKLMTIVRREMERAGAIELAMPAIQPAELWEESGRWTQYGKELLRMEDRHQRSFCFGPTHEEVITDVVRRDIKSYRQLPINLYQIQTKFRDEIRPRFGLMRGREFIMKDAYSFDVPTRPALEVVLPGNASLPTAPNLRGLPTRVHRGRGRQRCTIGGSSSHEFMVIAETGESDCRTMRATATTAPMSKRRPRQVGGTDLQERRARVGLWKRSRPPVPPRSMRSQPSSASPAAPDRQGRCSTRVSTR